MPRKSRIDAPGALHHVFARGIAPGETFLGDADRDDFLKRLGEILTKTNTACYAWALIPNRFHLLLRTGTFPLSSVMKRLLTGYAVGFNLKLKARSLLCYWATAEIGVKESRLAETLSLTQPAISIAARRGA